MNGECVENVLCRDFFCWTAANGGHFRLSSSVLHCKILFFVHHIYRLPVVDILITGHWIMHWTIGTAQVFTNQLAPNAAALTWQRTK